MLLRGPRDSLHLFRRHAAPAVVPVAVKAMQELVAKRGKGLGVHLAFRRRYVDRTHALVRAEAVRPLRAAADGKDFLATREALADALHVVDAVPDHGDVVARALRRGAGDEG